MKIATPKAMSLRAKINNYAQQHGIMAQVVLQNYMFECLLDRISHSKYATNFVIKGGILVSSLVGLDVRSTMDMDTTLLNLELTEDKIKQVFQDIINVAIDDNIEFSFVSVLPIRKDDVYGGFCLRLDAKYDTIDTPLSIDISTGDVITPKPLAYSYKRLFQTESIIHLSSYPIETILAEKIETIITRGVFNTRPRDFYDIYILTKTQQYDSEVLRKALFATAEHRGSKNIIETETHNRLAVINSSHDLKNQWNKYQKTFPYAKQISFDQVFEALKEVINEIQL